MDCSSCHKQFAVAGLLTVAASNLAAAAGTAIGQTLSVEVESYSESQSVGFGAR